MSKQQASLDKLMRECADLEARLAPDSAQEIIKEHEDLKKLIGRRKQAAFELMEKIAKLEGCSIEEVKKRCGVDEEQEKDEEPRESEPQDDHETPNDQD